MTVLLILLFVFIY